MFWGQMDDYAPISIHTPAKGVTRAGLLATRAAQDFNPHPREGGDWSGITLEVTSDNFNPHPREGGDQLSASCFPLTHNFNPHPREGGDGSGIAIIQVIRISIHTPAKGVTGGSA